MAIIYDSHEQEQRRLDALQACEAINAKLGWRGADPDYLIPSHHYTGGVVLSRRAAQELAKAVAA